MGPGGDDRENEVNGQKSSKKKGIRRKRGRAEGRWEKINEVLTKL